MRRGGIWSVTVLWICLVGVGQADEFRSIITSDSIVFPDSLRVFPGTDSVWVGGRLLARDREYTLDISRRVLILTGSHADGTDTVRLVYTKWPRWLEKTWGNALDQSAGALHRDPFAAPRAAEPMADRGGSNLRISGAKTFQITNGSGVGSAFGQSLDLGISGELAPGVQLSGAISDRGYDPINGFANARLDEFDRLHLRVTSSNFEGQVGDVNLKSLSPLIRNRDLSGGVARFNYPTRSAFAVAARPRGKYESARLSGRDGFQGPYQPTGAILAIVPGSEQVWLDGALLQRGADKDYSIDYPTGRISFGPTRPVDSRSRIEIDFEPASTPYRQELLAAGGMVRSLDSTRFFAMTIAREGDDKDRSLLELRPEDQRLLADAADSLVWRSGAVPDTLGAYRLIPDSLPDTVWQFVGVGNGDYTVTFSYVGAGQGSYRYVGNGQYQFAGHNLADHEPVILLRPAQRTESLQALGRMTFLGTGSVEADLRFSRSSTNLWNTTLPTADGAYHNLIVAQTWNWRGQIQDVKVRRQYVEATFRGAVRLDEPDFDRIFLVPAGMRWTGRRLRHDARVTASPLGQVSLSPVYQRLVFSNTFHSTVYGGDMKYRPVSSLTLTGAVRQIDAALTSDGSDKLGEGRSATGSAVIDVNQLQVTASVEYDRRSNRYSDSLAGTRFLRQTIAAAHGRDNVTYEGYREDTLTTDWRRDLNRHRLSLSTARELGRVRADGTLTHQWLDYPDRAERSFLGRINTAYEDPARQFIVSSGYTISDERRNARGYTYLQVDPGRGNYRLEDGQYIADQFGDYLRLEELLSDAYRVRRGEKTFRFGKQSRNAIITGASRINEERLAGSRRPWWWVVPFISDEEAAYLAYERRYEFDLKLVSWRGVYALSLTAGDSREVRLIVSERRVRSDSRLRLVFRQPVGDWHFEQGAEVFRARHDLFYGDEGLSDGWRGFLGSKRSLQSGEVTAELGFRKADGALQANGKRENSWLVSVRSSARFAAMAQGEMRIEGEGYRQTFSNLAGPASTVLSDNHDGTRGFNWVLSVKYGVSKTLKLQILLNGRYSDVRSSRLFARTEMTAEF